MRRTSTGLFISMLSWETKVGDYLNYKYRILAYVPELYLVPPKVLKSKDSSGRRCLGLLLG